MIKVLFFGILSSKTGVKETSIEARSGMKVGDLLKELRKLYPALPNAPYMVAVNEEQAKQNTTIKDKDEVAIMPPFSGG
ncbi:MAG: MoaD/ThiS family protein [Deltaproteobacteria bacterium]|nr:MoaD/ThiS family protein [Deltaproteobacteria bacterium]